MPSFQYQGREEQFIAQLNSQPSASSKGQPWMRWPLTSLRVPELTIYWNLAIGFLLPISTCVLYHCLARFTNNLQSVGTAINCHWTQLEKKRSSPSLYIAHVLPNAHLLTSHAPQNDSQALSGRLCYPDLNLFLFSNGMSDYSSGICFTSI